MPMSETALWVTVENSETGEPISHARVIATDGTYVTYLLEMQDMPGYYMGVYRSGVYRLDFSAAGYVSKSLEDVEVVWGREAHDPWYGPVGIVVSLAPEWAGASETSYVLVSSSAADCPTHPFRRLASSRTPISRRVMLQSRYDQAP